MRPALSGDGPNQHFGFGQSGFAGNRMGAPDGRQQGGIPGGLGGLLGNQGLGGLFNPR